MAWVSARARVCLSSDSPAHPTPSLPVTTPSLVPMSMSQTDVPPQADARRGSRQSPRSLPCPTTPASRQTQAKASSFSHKSMVIIRRSACGPACVPLRRGRQWLSPGKCVPRGNPVTKTGCGHLPLTDVFSEPSDFLLCRPENEPLAGLQGRWVVMSDSVSLTSPKARPRGLFAGSQEARSKPV